MRWPTRRAVGRVCHDARSLLQQCRELRVGAVDVALDVLHPLGLHRRVVVQIELAVDDAPLIGFDLDQVALCCTKRAVATVLRRVLLWARLEQIEVLLRGEQPTRAHPLRGERGVATHRLAIGEVSDRVVTLDRGVGALLGRARLEGVDRRGSPRDDAAERQCCGDEKRLSIHDITPFGRRVPKRMPRIGPPAVGKFQSTAIAGSLRLRTLRGTQGVVLPSAAGIPAGSWEARPYAAAWSRTSQICYLRARTLRALKQQTVGIRLRRNRCMTALTASINATRTAAIHPGWLRAAHWLNAVAVLIMVASGWRVYNAAPLFAFRFPREVTLGGWLGGALQWHFAGMWLLFINGLVYLALNLVTGRIGRKFFPLKVSDLWRDLRAAVRGRLAHADSRTYNSLQRAAYLVVIVDIALLVVSGLVLWKSVQFPLLRDAMGGYDGARLVHFFAMAALLAFVAGHLLMVALVPRTLVAMIRGR